MTLKERIEKLHQQAAAAHQRAEERWGADYGFTCAQTKVKGELDALKAVKEKLQELAEIHGPELPGAIEEYLKYLDWAIKDAEGDLRYAQESFQEPCLGYQGGKLNVLRSYSSQIAGQLEYVQRVDSG